MHKRGIIRYANYTVCASVFIHFCMQRKNNGNIPIIVKSIWICQKWWKALVARRSAFMGHIWKMFLCAEHKKWTCVINTECLLITIEKSSFAIKDYFPLIFKWVGCHQFFVTSTIYVFTWNKSNINSRKSSNVLVYNS